MLQRPLSVRVTFALTLSLLVLCSTFAAAQDDADTLVMQLPTNESGSNVELEKRIAGLGARGMPSGVSIREG